MKTILAPVEIRIGSNDTKRFEVTLKTLNANYGERTEDNHLDLSNVVYADSYGFRILFDIRSIFAKITPPKSSWVNDRYNEWVEGKKGLSK